MSSIEQKVKMDELDTTPTKYVSSQMEAIICEQAEFLAEMSTWKKIRPQPEFIYSDLDTLENELGEIYGFYELSSLSYNADMFRCFAETKQFFGEDWYTSDASAKLIFVEDLLDALEQANCHKQHDALLALNYLIQGCWKDLLTAEHQLKCIEEVTMMIIQCDGFQKLNSLFLYFMHQVQESVLWNWGVTERLLDGCLIVLCTITTIALRREENKIMKELLEELRSPRGDKYLTTAIKCFRRVLSKLSPRSFLLKKILIYIRNLILLSLGGTDHLWKLKNECRVKAGLLPCTEDTLIHSQKLEVIQTHPCWNQLKGRVNLMPIMEFVERVDNDECSKNCVVTNKSFRWSPKSSLQDLNDCMKECDWHRKNNASGVPITLQQRCTKLIQNLYVPLGVFQKEEVRLVMKYPSVNVKQENPNVDRTESFFSSSLPTMEHFVNMLTVVLSECIPFYSEEYLRGSSGKLPFVPRCGGDEKFYVEDSMREAEIIVKSISAIFILLLKHFKVNHVLQFDCIASAILESCFISTGLRFLNRDINHHLNPGPSFQHPDCPFAAINVDIIAHRLSPVKNPLLFNPEISWRNHFSYVNLLRIFGKLVKGKPSRILTLNVFKAHLCFKRCLNIKNALFQQYALKLLKLQCKYLDPEWKRENQRIISVIYHKVRHRMLDDWIGEISSSGRVKKRPDTRNKLKKWPWEYNAEDMIDQLKLVKYIERKFVTVGSEEQATSRLTEEFNMPESSNLNSLREDQLLPKTFLENYENWLEKEVFQKMIDWDNLLVASSLC